MQGMNHTGVVNTASNGPIKTEVKHKNAMGDIKSITISQGEGDRGHTGEVFCKPGIELEDIPMLVPSELPVVFKIVLRNVVRFRNKLRAQGEQLAHISLDERTKEAYLVMMKLVEVGKKAGISLKASL